MKVSCCTETLQSLVAVLFPVKVSEHLAVLCLMSYTYKMDDEIEILIPSILYPLVTLINK
jgi:hypothetical protein